MYRAGRIVLRVKTVVAASNKGMLSFLAPKRKIEQPHSLEKTIGFPSYNFSVDQQNIYTVLLGKGIFVVLSSFLGFALSPPEASSGRSRVLCQLRAFSPYTLASFFRGTKGSSEKVLLHWVNIGFLGYDSNL